MKKIVFFLLILSAACNQQATNETIPASTDSGLVKTAAEPPPKTTLTNEDKIIAIRAEVQRINQMNLLVKSFNWSEDGCVEGGKVNYYFNNDTIVKVAESGFIGDGGWTKEYYYSKGKFIFSFMQHIGGPAAMPVDTSEIRMYADNDTLVLQKRNNDSFDDLTKKYNPGSLEYRILAAYKDKNFAKVFCN